MANKLSSFIFWRWMKPLSRKYPEGKQDIKRVYKKYMEWNTNKKTVMNKHNGF